MTRLAEIIQLPADKTALVIVDMQNECIDSSGKIYIGRMGNAIVPKIRVLLETARNHKILTIYAQTWYEKDDPRFSNHHRASAPSNGCLANTFGAAIIDELKPISGDVVIRKSSFDCWFGTNLERALKSRRFGTFFSGSMHRNRLTNDRYVIVTGVSSNVCVDKAVFGFYLRGYEVIIPVDCIASKNHAKQSWAISQFRDLYHLRLTRSDLIKIT